MNIKNSKFLIFDKWSNELHMGQAHLGLTYQCCPPKNKTQNRWLWMGPFIHFEESIKIIKSKSQKQKNLNPLFSSSKLLLIWTPEFLVHITEQYLLTKFLWPCLIRNGKSSVIIELMGHYLLNLNIFLNYSSISG